MTSIFDLFAYNVNRKAKKRIEPYLTLGLQNLLEKQGLTPNSLCTAARTARGER